MEMKIRKRTILWFVLAVLVIAAMFAGNDGTDSDTDKLTWTDAVYVKDAKVLPENEGKLVAVPGHPEMLETAGDEIVGVSFQSPRVHRAVEALKYSSTFRDWTVKIVSEGTSKDGFEGDILYGRAAIGDFELDEELIKRGAFYDRTVEKDDFTSEDIAHMESTGSLIKSGGAFCYTDGEDMYTDGIWDNPDEYDHFDYALHKDWNGSHLVRWSMWEIKPDDEVTVVGIQKGNMLTYCEELSGAVSKDRIVSEEELKSESDPANPVLVKVMELALALLFVLLGVRSMRTKKKED